MEMSFLEGLCNWADPLEEVEALTKLSDIIWPKICAALPWAFVGTNFYRGAQHNSDVSLFFEKYLLQ